MGSGKSGGSSASTSYDYFGTIRLLIGIGPLQAIHSLLEDQATVGDWPVTRSGDSELVTIADRGPLRIYWGTSTQPANDLLATYAYHPRYKDQAGLVGEDFLFGREKESAPNWELVASRVAQQSVITGAAAALDADDQANIVAWFAEVVTSKYGLAQPVSRLDQASWQAVADSLQTPEQRSLYAVSPIITEQVKAREHIASIGALSGVFIRRNTAGKIAMGRWSPPTDTSSLVVVTARDLYSVDSVDTEDMASLPTDYTIQFTDRNRLYKKGAERVPDLAAVRADSELRTENLNSPEVTDRAQARRRVMEYMRQKRGGAIKGTLPLMRAKGRKIKPGDYFLYDEDPIPDGTSSLILMRCLRVRFGPEGSVRVECRSEPGAVPVPYVTPTSVVELTTEIVVPPLVRPRVLSLKPYSGESPAVTVLAARPDPNVIGMDVLFDQSSTSGTFPIVGQIGGFALPVKLATAVTAVASTVRVMTFATFPGGSQADRDRWILSNGRGAGATEAADDRLVLILLKRDPATGAIVPTATGKAFEVMSISAISLVASDTWDLTVLRGRMGSSPMVFDASAGATFPDPFSYFEGWVVPSASIERLGHADFTAMTKAMTPGIFRLRPWTKASRYDPAVAHEAGLQAAAAWDDYSYTFPADDLTTRPADGALTGVELINPVVVNTVAAPSISPGAGLFTTSITLSISAPDGAVVRYSTTGDVTANSPEWPKSSGAYTTMTLASTTTLNVRAFINEASSDQITAVYTLNTTTPKCANPTVGGTTQLNNTPPINVQFNLACATPGASMKYRYVTVSTGSAGAWTTGWAADLQVYPSSGLRLEAMATCAGYNDSNIVSIANS